MKKILAFALLTALLTACNKSKFQTLQQVKITSFGPKTAVVGDVIVLKADVTDKEGDAHDSALFARKKLSLANFVVQSDTIRKSLNSLNVPNTQEYELSLSLKYGQQADGFEYQTNSDGVDRKLVIGVIVKDKAGTRSNYVESDTIVLKKI